MKDGGNLGEELLNLLKTFHYFLEKPGYMRSAVPYYYIQGKSV